MTKHVNNNERERLMIAKNLWLCHSDTLWKVHEFIDTLKRRFEIWGVYHLDPILGIWVTHIECVVYKDSHEC